MTRDESQYEITTLLSTMVEHDASDLYITVDTTPTYRVNGVLRSTEARKLTAQDTQALAFSIMTDQQRAQFGDALELNIALSYENLGRFRVNFLQQRNDIAVVIRRIKTDIPTIEHLALPDVLKSVAMTKRGLVLFVGATGAGKSTSLAAMIDYRNTNDAAHIVCVEDPIEFVHEHKRSVITQREVGIDTHSYGEALKNCLRQAPDVILLGEIRDTETMECALQFAETGHLCLATLHSNNANQAMERVMNFFPAERHPQIYLQLSLNLRGIISQRLVRKKGGGRVAAFEILLDSPRIRDLIHKSEIAELKECMEKSTNLGMCTFDQSLFALFQAGTITFDEAIRNADSPNNLRLRIKLAQEEVEPISKSKKEESAIGKKLGADDFKLDL